MYDANIFTFQYHTQSYTIFERNKGDLMTYLQTLFKLWSFLSKEGWKHFELEVDLMD